MTEQLGVERRDYNWIEVLRAQLSKLGTARFQKMRSMRVSRLIRRTAIVKFFVFILSCDAVILHAGELSNAACLRTQMLQRKIEPDVTVKLAIRRMSRIAYLRAPNLPAGVTVARERR